MSKIFYNNETVVFSDVCKTCIYYDIYVTDNHICSKCSKCVNSLDALYDNTTLANLALAITNNYREL